eukprot:5699189-Heterocapsa_arctica.AAC.1
MQSGRSAAASGPALGPGTGAYLGNGLASRSPGRRGPALGPGLGASLGNGLASRSPGRSAPLELLRATA